MHRNRTILALALTILVSACAPEASGNASGVAEQHERLRAAFSN